MDGQLRSMPNVFWLATTHLPKIDSSITRFIRQMVVSYSQAIMIVAVQWFFALMAIQGMIQILALWNMFLGLGIGESSVVVAVPKDKVWIGPDDSVWTQNPDGSYEEHGNAGDYTGSGKPSGQNGKDRGNRK